MPPTSIIITITILAILLLTILTIATHHLLARRRRRTPHAEDTIGLTLNGPRSPEQVEYMKGVRERNLIIAWEEATQFKALHSNGRTAMAVGSACACASAFDENKNEPATYSDHDGANSETDLGSGSASVKSTAMVLSTSSQIRSQQHLAPPMPPWMKRSPTMGSSVCSSDSAKSKTPTVVQEWEAEHGGFSSYLGMKQPVTQERWI